MKNISEKMKKNIEEAKQNEEKIKESIEQIKITIKNLSEWQKKLLKYIGISFVVLLLIGIFAPEPEEELSPIENTIFEEVEPEIITCDGEKVTTDCEFDGVVYSLYKYHPAVAEKSHYEKKIVGYETIITGYCTLCNDGTRSPSCSTGSGTCSRQGGVKQWNAPIYREQAIYEDVKVIDVEASQEWIEKVEK